MEPKPGAAQGEPPDAPPEPPAILFALAEAARSLPPDRRPGPFRGVGGADELGNEGVSFDIGGREFFLTDDDAGALIAGDYLDVSPTGAGDAAVHLLPRALVASHDRGT